MNRKVVWLHQAANDEYDDSKEWHTCPYAEDINGDYESLCDCDAEQTSQCAMDI